MYYFCTRNRERKPEQPKELGYGVMVTLQILVLSFLVRVRVPQQSFCRCKSKDLQRSFLYEVRSHKPFVADLKFSVFAAL